jgi:hypothetical protein
MASEDQEAEAFSFMFEHAYPTVWAFTYHVPNEGKHKAWYRKAQRKRGVKPGVPDYHIAYPFGGFPGLYIELKKKGGGLTKSGNVSKRGTVSDEQKEWLERFKEVGFATAVCWGAEEAMEVVTAYLEGRFS